MKINVACPKCKTLLELEAGDQELSDHLARKVLDDVLVKNEELRAKGEKFVRSYSDGKDARLLIWSTASQQSYNSLGIVERFYEYAFVVEKLGEMEVSGWYILDVGSAQTTLPSILAALGNVVTCVDVSEWQMTWPGVKVIRGDLLQPDLSLPFGSFDFVTCVSAMEHFGLGRYEDIENVDGDFEGMKVLSKCLKPRGRMILTVPVGKPAVVFPAHRIYDQSRYSRLTLGFQTLEKRFFLRKPETRGVFFECEEEEAYLAEPYLKDRPGYAIGCFLLGNRRAM